MLPLVLAIRVLAEGAVAALQALTVLLLTAATVARLTAAATLGLGLHFISRTELLCRV